MTKDAPKEEMGSNCREDEPAKAGEHLQHGNQDHQCLQHLQFLWSPFTANTKWSPHISRPR